MMRLFYSVMFLLSVFLIGADAGTLTDVLKNNKGVGLLNDGQTEKALEVFSELLGHPETPPETYYNLGGIFSEKGDYDKAIEAYQKSLEGLSESKKSKSYYNLGNAYFGKASYKEAIDAYKQALLKDDTLEKAKYNLELAQLRLDAIPPTQDQKQAPNESSKKDPSDSDDSQDQTESSGASSEEKSPSSSEQSNPPDSSQEQSGQGLENPQDLQEWKAKQLLNSLEQKEKDVLERYLKEKYKGQSQEVKKDW